MCSKPNPEMPRFAAEKRFIQGGVRKTNLRSTSLMVRGSRYLWDKEAGSLRHELEERKL